MAGKGESNPVSSAASSLPSLSWQHTCPQCDGRRRCPGVPLSFVPCCPLETVTTELVPGVGRESTQVTKPRLGPAWQSLQLCALGNTHCHEAQGGISVRCFISASRSQHPDLQVPFVTLSQLRMLNGHRRCVFAAIYGLLWEACSSLAGYGSSLVQLTAWHPLHMRK